jgi:hypothetical protein
MPLTRRMTGLHKEPAHWYLDVGGRRAGPYDWTVILELARSGGLGWDDLLWCPEFTAWKPVAAFPELAAVLASESRPRTDPIGAGPRDSVGVRRQGPSRVRLAVAGGLAWTVVVYVCVTLSWEGWSGIQDGVLGARLQVFLPLILLALGVVALPSLWAATRPTGGLRSGFLRGAVRILAAGSAFCLVVITLSLFINARDTFYVALGADPMGHAELQVLRGGTELEVRGLLGAGTASQLARALVDHPGIRFVHLNSRGGWVTEGQMMARLIRAHKLGTYTSTGCYSACVLAFVAGSPRVLNPEARLGLHSVSGEGTDPLFIEKINESYQSDLRRAGASEPFVRRATFPAPTDLWMPDPSELIANHLLDLVSADGLATSGESLPELAEPAAQVEREYPFMQLLARTDPTRFAQLDRAIRLAIRRGADESDVEHYASDLAAQIEVRRLPTVTDETVEEYARGLRSAARRLAVSQPQQCVALLAWNRHDLVARSAAALREMDPALKMLLAAPITVRPPSIESDARALSKVIDLSRTRRRIPSTESTGNGARATCTRLLLMFDFALNQNQETSAGFMRALRTEAGVYVQGTVDR